MKDKLFDPRYILGFCAMMFVLGFINVEMVDARSYDTLTWGKIPFVLFCTGLAWSVISMFIKRK